MSEIENSDDIKEIILENREDLINFLKNTQYEYVILKFYADWCIECKHVEKNILTDREVTEKLNQFILINTALK